MLALTCDIRVGALAFDFVHEVVIESAWAKFTDTATITLPRKVKVVGSRLLPDVVRVGDDVRIRYGYDGTLRTEFTGYVSELKPGTPFVIKCEDQMWALKRATFSKSWRDVSLRQLLEYIRGAIGLDFELHLLGEQHLGKYQINQATGAQVFDDLKKRFGVCCFFRQGVLWASKPYDLATAATHRYGFTRNIIESELAYTQAEDVAEHFRATSVQRDGKKIQVDYDTVSGTFAAKVPVRHHKGDPKATPGASATGSGVASGQLRTLNAGFGLSEAQLQAWVKEWAQQHHYTGYRGGLTGFGLPAAEHGDVATITDPDYPERAGAYFIDAVTKTFGVSGSRRKLKLGPKAAL
jgi:hypothetical protein